MPQPLPIWLGLLALPKRRFSYCSFLFVCTNVYFNCSSPSPISSSFCASGRLCCLLVTTLGWVSCFTNARSSPICRVTPPIQENEYAVEMKTNAVNPFHSHSSYNDKSPYTLVRTLVLNFADPSIGKIYDLLRIGRKSGHVCI